MTFGPGDYEKAISITILSDDDVEDKEEFEISIEVTSGTKTDVLGELWKATVVINSEDTEVEGTFNPMPADWSKGIPL